MRNTNTAFDFWTIRLEEGDEPEVVKPIVRPVVTPVVVTPVVVTPVTEKKKSILDKVKDILSKIVQYVKRLF